MRMSLNEFDAAVGRMDGGCRASLVEAACRAEGCDGEECVEALAGLLKGVVIRCREIGWTFSEIAEKVIDGCREE